MWNKVYNNPIINNKNAVFNTAFLLSRLFTINHIGQLKIQTFVYCTLFTNICAYLIRYYIKVLNIYFRTTLLTTLSIFTMYIPACSTAIEVVSFFTTLLVNIMPDGLYRATTLS